MSLLMQKCATIQTLTIITAGIITFSIFSHYWKKKRRRSSPKAVCFIKAIFCSPKSTVNKSSKVSLTHTELSNKGLACLCESIKYWEQALQLDDDLKLQQLVKGAYKLKELYESTNDFNTQQSVYGSLINSSESFVSAQDDVADLNEFVDDSLCFYQYNHKVLIEKGIPYRSLRTEFMHCMSDDEYLVKLHCIRQAFQYVLKDSVKKMWIINMMQDILSNLIRFAGKDPTLFLTSYADMIKFVEDTSNHTLIEQELAVRNVRTITFYDVALDYILLDAFEDLEHPPSSVLSVIQNRWLSNSFKETALTTAVWSVIKAKRCLLKCNDGFRSRFYTLSEQIIPFMAWGFLGPDDNLKNICQSFKNEMLTFFIEIYDFNKCRYTSVEDLATDVFDTFKVRAENISKMFNL